MRVRINDTDREFVYKNVNFIKINGEDFIINYQGENDEECEEIGPIPGDLIVKDTYESLYEIEELFKRATNVMYGSVDEKRASRVFNSILSFTNIRSIDDLLAYDVDKISDIKGIGRVSLNIIRKAICLAKEEK